MNKTLMALTGACMLAATTLHAAELYKSIMPDGKTIYGEKPVPGAKHVEALQEPPAQSGILTITPQDKARASQLPEPTGPAVTIIPQRERPPIQSLGQGASQNPSGALPKREY